MERFLAVTVDDLLSRPGQDDPNLVQEYQEAGAFADLPDVDQSQLASSAINTVLGFSSALAVIAIVIAGIYYLISRGNEEETTKAKNIILYLVIGMVIIASSYAIITGIAKFNFFQTP